MLRSSMSWALGAAAVVACVFLVWLFARSADEPRVDRLPLEARSALYERTLADLELCATSSGDFLGRHCLAQAEFIEQFPECDDACHRLASRWGSHPTR